jgi:hypothetical protein
VSYEGAVKVVDFGIARAATRTTETGGGLAGKLRYMAPEQCLEAPLDRRTDVFAIGILLFELTTGTHLFDAAGDYAIMQQIIHAPVPSPGARRADYPAALEAIVARALARDPGERYPTAQALQLALEELARELRLATSAVALERLMAELFADDLAAWGAARERGLELDDFVLETATGAPPSREAVTATVPQRGARRPVAREPDRTRRDPPRWRTAALGGAIAAAGLAVGLGVARPWYGALELPRLGVASPVRTAAPAPAPAIDAPAVALDIPAVASDPPPPPIDVDAHPAPAAEPTRAAPATSRRGGDRRRPRDRTPAAASRIAAPPTPTPEPAERPPEGWDPEAVLPPIK